MIVEEYSEEFESDLDRRYLTPEEYIEVEKHSELRHEYFDGTITAMAGCSENHELLAMKLAFLLMQHLQGKPCRVHKAGMEGKGEGSEQNRLLLPRCQGRLRS